MDPAGGGSPLTMLVPFALIFAVFYFIVILPAKKQQKKKETMIAGLKKGDRIVTTGGIFGTVAAVEDQSLLVKVSENVKIRITKSAVAGPVSGEGAPPAE
jgi:preprotein translocase subunit YajC